MSQNQNKSESMTTLAAGDLDIDELERRLELATATVAAPDWCNVDTCNFLCNAVCKSYTGP
ncbi:MAG TPA: hypothetical protein VIV40_37680 [Kofleriaceae bacterium]